MSIAIILRRMWRNWRVLAALLLAMTLTSGFLGLAPLYIRIVTESGLQFSMQRARAGAYNLLINSEERILPESMPALRDDLGNLVRDYEERIQTFLPFCSYVEANLDLQAPCTDPRAPLPVAYERLQERMQVVEGRFPQATDDPALIEVVMVDFTARRVGRQIGDELPLLSQDRQATAVIVGLVEPVDARDPFWDARQTAVLEGQLVDVTDNFQRIDYGVIADVEEFQREIASLLPFPARYQWYVNTDLTALHVWTLDQVNADLARAQTRLRVDYQSVQFDSGIDQLIARTQARIASTEPTVILMFSGLLLLMLYQLATTVGLILERETPEWASISSRGASTGQLVVMQFTTVGLLGLAAFMLGVPMALLMLWLMERAGPLAAILEGTPVGLIPIPPITVALSAAATIAAVIVLTIPAWRAAHQSVLSLKQSASRPPTTPAWTRYFLDVLLLVIGGGLLLRLVLLLSDNPLDLLRDPAAIPRLLNSDAAVASGITSDPFNMVSAALLLTGAALLWMRIFPLLMRGVSALLSRLRSLLMPLALWNVERDPAHYAQLVMLLIGTLALGTASLALGATHDTGAWNAAVAATGANVRVSTTQDLQPVTALPGVTESVRWLRAVEDKPAGNAVTTLLGVAPEDLPRLSSEVLAPLNDLPPYEMGGVPIPTDAVQVTLYVYAQPMTRSNLMIMERDPNDRTVIPITIPLALDLYDANGLTHTLPLSVADETLTGAWQPYSATLPTDSTYRVAAVRIQSRTSDSSEFRHSISLDALTFTNASGAQTIAEDFEAANAPDWTTGGTSVIRMMSTHVSSAQAFSGQNSLDVEYAVVRDGVTLADAVLPVARVVGERLPVIVSPALAEHIGRVDGALRRTLRAGDQATLALTFGRDTTLEVPIRVIDVVSAFPTMDARSVYTGRFLITRADYLAPMLNTIGTTERFFALNEAWLTMETRAPGAAFEAALAQLPTAEATLAWDAYNELRREPFPNAITGMLFAAFWVSLALGLLDFAFYLAMTAERRAMTFAVLRALGWSGRRVWGMLMIEQAALVLPALVIGVGLGALLGVLLLPLLALLGSEPLRFPALDISALVGVLTAAFTLMLVLMAARLVRQDVNRVLRMGE